MKTDSCDLDRGYSASRLPSLPSRPTAGRCLGIAVAGVLAVTVLSGCQQKDESKGPAASQQTEVSVLVLHPQDVAVTAQLAGRTSASLVAEVRPQVSGIIKERLFKEGSDIKAGDVLYQIDDASYQATYDSDVATLKKAEAAVPSAQAKVDRYKGLIKQNAVSKQDLDDALSTLAQDQAAVAVAKADVETAKINLQHTKITAPISGRIGASSVTVGALVTADQTTALATIRKLDPMNVDITQSSTNLLNFRNAVSNGRIKLQGPHVSVHLTLDNGEQYAETGTLEFAEANVSETTGTFTLRATFPNPKHILLPGMYVQATLEEGVAPNSYLLPQRAVDHDSTGKATAKFVDANGKVSVRTLTLERNVGDNWLVQKGISDGDRLIVEGGQLVRAGQTVSVAEAKIDPSTGLVEEASNQKAGAGAGSGQAAVAQTKSKD